MPQIWPKSQVLYWAFNQKPKVALWCIFDLLNRLILFPTYWKDLTDIPVGWHLGDAKTKALAFTQLEKINLGEWNYDGRPSLDVKRDSFNEWRHQSTPYDYEWQTEKYSRDDAYKFWKDRFNLKLKKENMCD